MLWAVIMAGGLGTRFWPESRKKTPKQFLPLLSQKTLLEETIERLRGVVPPSRILVITQQDKVALARKLAKQVPASQIIGEPIGRNTAPCAALAAAVAYKKDPSAVIALFPADHHIGKKQRFQSALKAAHQFAIQSKLPVTFGIKPSQAHTGYGYLERDRLWKKKGSHQVYVLKRFWEKPNLKRAQKFVKSTKFLWNSGMFVWCAEELLAETKKKLPKLDSVLAKIMKGAFQKNLKKHFPKMPNVSIDYGLMEKLKGKILTMPVDFGWNDIGGWMSFSELCPRDSSGNVVFGNTLVVDSKNNVVRGQKKLIALLGVQDHVVVDTADALLICPKDQTEAIRKIVSALGDKKLSKYL